MGRSRIDVDRVGEKDSIVTKSFFTGDKLALLSQEIVLQTPIFPTFFFMLLINSTNLFTVLILKNTSETSVFILEVILLE